MTENIIFKVFITTTNYMESKMTFKITDLPNAPKKIETFPRDAFDNGWNKCLEAFGEYELDFNVLQEIIRDEVKESGWNPPCLAQAIADSPLRIIKIKEGK